MGHTFEGRPVYRDGGVPIKYSAYVVSAVGEYIPSTDGLHITMGYEVETVDNPYPSFGMMITTVMGSGP